MPAPATGVPIACALTIVGCLCLAPGAAAQEPTRTQEIEAKQKEKSGKLAPYQPSGAERFLTRLE